MVMISSTVDDLSVEREVVDSAIRDFRFERFRSESMGSFSESPRAVCEAAARGCDVFVLIAGERYGWVIPDLAISVVEREFDVARAAQPGKILVYVKASDSRDSRQHDFITKITDFTTGYFRARPFPSATELGNRFREDLAGWLSNRLLASGMPMSTLLGASGRSPTRRSWLILAFGILTFLGLSDYLVRSAVIQPSLAISMNSLMHIQSGY